MRAGGGIGFWVSAMGRASGGMKSEDAHVLRVSAQMLGPKTGSPTRNSVTASPNLGHLAGELGSEDPALRPAETRAEAADHRRGAPPAAVGPRDRRRVHRHEDLVSPSAPGARRPRAVGRRAARTGRERPPSQGESRRRRWIGQQSTSTALLGAERFPDVSTALSTTSVNPMPCSVQYAIVELPPITLSRLFGTPLK